MFTSLFSASRPRLAVLLVSLGLSLSSHAQTSAEAQAHRVAIEAFYPVMVAHVNEGRFDDARTLCQQAIKWEPQNPLHYYNLGCIESKAGRGSQALAALNQATSKGYADVNSLRTDTDLDAVRSDARFAAVVQAASRNGGAAGATASAARGGASIRPVNAITRPRAEAAGASAASAGGNPGPAAMPAAASWNNGKLTGLFFMTKFWIMSNSLEKAVWYFAPDGRVYHDPVGGFSPAALAAHKGRKGTYRLSGGQLNVTWSDGKTSGGNFAPTSTSFSWDAGIFTPVKSFANARALVGQYEGGNSVRGASASSSLDLRADGTYANSSAGSVSSTSSTSTVTASGEGQARGRWALSGYTLTLTDDQGKVTQGIAFPYDDPKTALYPDRFYFAGTMYNKKQ